MSLTYVLPKSKFTPAADAFSGWFTATNLSETETQVEYYTKAVFLPATQQELQQSSVNFCLFPRQISNDITTAKNNDVYRWTCNRAIDYEHEFLPMANAIGNNITIRFGGQYLYAGTVTRIGFPKYDNSTRVEAESFVLSGVLGGVDSTPQMQSSFVAEVVNTGMMTVQYRTAQDDVYISNVPTTGLRGFSTYQNYMGRIKLYCKAFRADFPNEFELTQPTLYQVYDRNRNPRTYVPGPSDLILTPDEDYYEDDLYIFDRSWLNENESEKSYIAIIRNGFFADIYLENLFNAIDFTVSLNNSTGRKYISRTALTYTGAGEPRLRIGSIFLSGNNF